MRELPGSIQQKRQQMLGREGSPRESSEVTAALQMGREGDVQEESKCQRVNRILSLQVTVIISAFTMGEVGGVSYNLCSSDD